MRYIFVVRAYEPDPSASGSLIRSTVEVLSRTDPVTVVASATTESLANPPRNRPGEYEVIRVPRRDAFGERSRTRPTASKRRLSRSFSKVLDTGIRIARYILGVAYTDRTKQQRRIFVDQLRQLSLQPEDVVIPCTADEIHACVELRDYQEFRLSPFFHESLPVPNVSGGTFGLLTRRHAKHNHRLERRIVEASFRIYALPAVFSRLTEQYSEHSAKFVATEHPMLRDESLHSKSPRNEGDRFVYAGGLDRTNRNPKYMLELFHRLSAARDAHLHLFTYGNRENQIRDPRFAESIIAHGRVGPARAMDEMRIADFLVTQANLSNNITPSKIFDCMSTGLPIVHLYHHEDDQYLRYLERYGLALAIRIGSDIDESVRTLLEFCDSARGQRVSYANLSKEFPECTPEHFCELLHRTQGRVIPNA